MYPPTPNRLARQPTSENNSSSTSENGSDSSTNGSHSDEVAVFCRLRPLSLVESEVALIFWRV